MSSAASSETAGAPKQERKLSDTIPLEAVHRIAKLPMVESSISIANDVYSRVKESNAMINWTLSTAESTMSKAAEHAIPVAEKMEKHLKRVDSLLCSSLDYVEAKVPAVKLPPHELMEKASELKQMGAEKVRTLAALESSSTKQLVSSCTKIAASGVEAAQRYMHTASAHLTNGEDAHGANNGHGGPSLAPLASIAASDLRHPIYAPRPQSNGVCDAAPVSASAAPDAVLVPAESDDAHDESHRKPKRRH
ncbi:lipid storage droplets surface-binding protein 1-like isoform X2 [Neocloeon triangulifer]|uniref:lipid storage droplets surface-binding protein 1-like isoform X2 n=1 Tax=Neocloeon triangulifer TaxID=2078957 RepID=UPI00286EFFF9|nr:lipid storage droplets surface-binding protein 1-like isoform X2 [Neocloeon triangulifer]